ncbi:hypothetical protein BD779DRAFT_1677729 [Infundibulicybe gibba]|nr:hypothetical protein BD779DRAFT_1677729 [Infundibulicybe gibba]
MTTAVHHSATTNRSSYRHRFTNQIYNNAPRKSSTKRKARVVSDSSIEILEPPPPPSPPKKKLASAKPTPAGTERPVYEAFPLSSSSITAQLDAIFSESATTGATRPPQGIPRLEPPDFSDVICLSSRVRVKTEKAKLLANSLSSPTGHDTQSDVTASPSTRLSKIALTTPTATPKISRVSSARQTSPDPHARSRKLPTPVAGSGDSDSDDFSMRPLPSLFHASAPGPEKLSADMGSPTPSEESTSGAPVDVNAINRSEVGSDDGGESSCDDNASITANGEQEDILDTESVNGSDNDESDIFDSPRTENLVIIFYGLCNRLPALGPLRVVHAFGGKGDEPAERVSFTPLAQGYRNVPERFSYVD